MTTSKDYSDGFRDAVSMAAALAAYKATDEYEKYGGFEKLKNIIAEMWMADAVALGLIDEKKEEAQA